MKPKPTVGQTLFILNVGDNCSKYRPQELSLATVVSVGRKYFAVRRKDFEIDIKFRLSDFGQETWHSVGWKIYESEQGCHDEKEQSSIHERMRKVFDFYSRPLTLTKLRKIAAILDEKEDAAGNGIIFAVSNDGGKTGVAWREDVNEALAYLDLQNVNGGNYAVVVVRKADKKEPNET